MNSNNTNQPILTPCKEPDSIFQRLKDTGCRNYTCNRNQCNNINNNNTNQPIEIPCKESIKNCQQSNNDDSLHTNYGYVPYKCKGKIPNSFFRKRENFGFL